MPRIDITDADIVDVAGYLHSLHVANYSAAPEKPINIVVGNAADGKKTFDGMCASCHSVDKELAHIGARFTDPRALQQAWLLPSGPGRAFPGQPPPPPPPGFHVPPMTVSVALPTGTVEGTLERIDDFYVALRTKDGAYMSFDRPGDVIGASVSPFWSSSTIAERRRLGPTAPPAASDPWQNEQLTLYTLFPRATTSGGTTCVPKLIRIPATGPSCPCAPAAGAWVDGVCVGV